MALKILVNTGWLIISKVLWHSSEDIIIGFEDTNQYSKTEDYIFKITLRSPRANELTAKSNSFTTLCHKTEKNIWLADNNLFTLITNYQIQLQNPRHQFKCKITYRAPDDTYIG